MPIDFRNLNTLWSSVLVETLHRLGLKTAIICPGSRSAPLAIAFAQHSEIEAIPILDERSAAFFALGLARKSHQPVVLVCTSGTAGANFYPAIIEARESRVPLLVLTADRPPELRDCNAGQAIDQQKLFGSYPNFYAEIALPDAESTMLAYLRQTVMQAWQQTQYPIPGVVHLNLPFRDPLVPIAHLATQSLEATFPPDFFHHIRPSLPPSSLLTPHPSLLTPHSPRGLILAGAAQPSDPIAYCQAIAHLSKTFGMPVLAEGLSPLRNHASLNPYLISTYDTLLRNAELADKLAPDVVIRVGEMPTSKALRQWLTATQPNQWVIDPSDRSLDPLHGKTIHLPTSIEAFVTQLSESVAPSPYTQLWCEMEAQMRRAIDQKLSAETALFEGKAAWLLSQHLPHKTPLFISSSMPIRDVEFFWMPNDSAIQPFFNRGANGIDGILSTALGIAHHNQASVLLTGDLALLHDTNGFLNRDRLIGSLTIIVINNNGGGIFGMLPIAQFNPPFEEFFATPQNIDFANLCQTYNVDHQPIHTWEQLIQQLNPLPPQGIRVLEIKTDRQSDAQWRQNNLSAIAASLS
ncbi:2-succinyl-5-enolpyruvyl-6-hydroxy-3-cyclohexene-1-carboxylic-acid synthase [Phormidesmis sp. 146-33]